MTALVHHSLTNRQVFPAHSRFAAPRRSEVFAGLGTTLRLWRRRMRERRELAVLSPRDLRDIGVSSSDVWHEIRLPFWRSSLRR